MQSCANIELLHAGKKRHQYGARNQHNRNGKMKINKQNKKQNRYQKNLKNHNSSQNPYGPCNKLSSAYVHRSLFSQDKLSDHPEPQPCSGYCNKSEQKYCQLQLTFHELSIHGPSQIFVHGKQTHHR